MTPDPAGYIPQAVEHRGTCGVVLFVSKEIPACDEMFSPVLAAIPLQLLAYYTATALGRDVDQPRNLAKSVTVE